MYEQDPRETYREERSHEGPGGYERPPYERPPLERQSYEERVLGPAYNYRAVQIVWFVFTLIDGLIAIRFTLKILGAAPQAAFVSFIYGLTAPLVAPFRGIFPDTGQGFYVFEASSLVAIVVYLLLGWAIVALIRITTAPRGPRRAL